MIDEAEGLSEAVAAAYERGRYKGEDISVVWTLLKYSDILPADLDWVADVATMSDDDYDWHFGAILLVISTLPLSEARAKTIVEFMRELDEGSCLEALYAIGLANRHVDELLVHKVYAQAMETPGLAEIAKNHPPLPHA